MDETIVFVFANKVVSAVVLRIVHMPAMQGDTHVVVKRQNNATMAWQVSSERYEVHMDINRGIGLVSVGD